MNNGINQNDNFDYEAYRIYNEKKQEKRRIISALAACCILILGSYLSVSLLYFVMASIVSYLSESFSFLESDLLVIDTFAGILAYCVQLAIPAAVFMLFRRKKYRDCIFVSNVTNDEKIRAFEIILFAFSAFAVSSILSIVSSVFTSVIGLDGSAFEVESAKTVAGLVIELISVAVLPAFLEEFFFRGVILTELLPFGKGFAIIASALFFATAHGSIEQILFSFSYGVIFAYIAISSGSILPGIIIHFCNNAYATILGYLENILSVQMFELLGSICYFVLVGIGLVCTAIILGKNKIRLKDNTKGVLTKGEILKTLASPVMLIYYLLIFIETISTYLLG